MLSKTNKNSFILIFILLINLPLINSAQTNLTLPENISIYRLNNGLQIMLVENDALPMVGINTVVKVGSAYENFATSGTSHMLEHLLFNGTSTMSQKELYDSTDIIGGYNNANTGEYYTNFMMVTPAENIEAGIKLQSAMLFDSQLPEEKFAKEKGIVLEEIAKSLGNPNYQMENDNLALIFNGHALSLPTLGTYSTIENMNRDYVYNFYKNYYVPNNMIVSVIGNFEKEQILKILKETFGKEAPANVNYIQSKNWETGFDKTSKLNSEKIYHRFYSGDKTQLQIFFPITEASNSQVFDLMEITLDLKELSIKQELNNSFENSVEGLKLSIKQSPIQDYLQASLTLKSAEKIDEIRSNLTKKINEIDFSISDETIKTQAIKAKTRFLQNIEKPHMFGIYNASLFAERGIESVLSSYSAKSFYNARKELINMSIPAESITVIYHPESKTVNEKEKSSNKINTYKKNPNSPIVITKQNDNSDLLAIHYLIMNKSLLENKYGEDAAKILHTIFGNRMDEIELQKEISKYGFTFTVNDNPYIPMDNIYLNPQFGYIRVEGLANNIDSAISFLNNKILKFKPTKSEFGKATVQSQMSRVAGSGGNNARKIFKSKLQNILYANNDLENNARELTYESMLKFTEEYFTPSNMIITVVAPERGEKINNLFKSFTNKKNSALSKIGKLKEFNLLNTPQKIEVNGNGEQSYLYYGFQKNIDKNDEAALNVLSMLLSNQITFDIREKQGMTYRMSAGVDVKKDKAIFNINMATRPGNVDKLVPQFPSFFDKSFVDGVTKADVKKVINKYLSKMMFRRLSSINQAYYLGYSKYFYDDVNRDTKTLEEIKNIRLQDVKRVAAKYLQVENPIEVYVK